MEETTQIETTQITNEAGTRRRVLLKLSGEVFGGGNIGVDPVTVRGVAEQIAATVGEVETAIVVGEETSSAGPNSPSRAWTAPAPTTWACSEPS